MKTLREKYSAFLFASACLFITAQHSFGEPVAAEAAAITAIAEDFHKALAAGDADRVMSLLAPDALIVEAGTVQTRDEYRREHLTEDIAFARAVPVTSRNVVVRQDGNAAWVTTRSRMIGEFRKKSVDSTGAETVILTRTSEGWRIRSIHWSSHSAPDR